MSNALTLKLMARGDREIVMTRAFDAPRRLVFDALTRPELIRQWLLGPPGWTMPVCEIDLKVGGRFRYVWRRTSGEPADCGGEAMREMGMGGVYREIVAPERIVHTELFDEDWTSGETLVTSVLTEQAGRTVLTTTVLYASREAREMVIKSPMESGVAASYDRLAELLATRAGQEKA